MWVDGCAPRGSVVMWLPLSCSCHEPAQLPGINLPAKTAISLRWQLCMLYYTYGFDATNTSHHIMWDV